MPRRRFNGLLTSVGSSPFLAISQTHLENFARQLYCACDQIRLERFLFKNCAYRLHFSLFFSIAELILSSKFFYWNLKKKFFFLGQYRLLASEKLNKIKKKVVLELFYTEISLANKMIVKVLELRAALERLILLKCHRTLEDAFFTNKILSDGIIHYEIKSFWFYIICLSIKIEKKNNTTITATKYSKINDHH